MGDLMSIKRRNFLATAGGGLILAAGAGGAFWGTRRPDQALEAWDRAGDYEDPRKRALSYAILSPNPHNQQPWLVDLSQPHEITLFVDSRQLLPQTDPYSRQITVGLGCFTELLVLAANAFGYAVEIELFPNGSDSRALDERPIFRARFEAKPNQRRDPLFDVALARRSLKEPFDVARPVPSTALAALLRSGPDGVRIEGTTEESKVAALRDLTWRAHHVEMHTPAKLRESIDVMRFGKNEINARPDGIDLGGPFLESLMMLGQLDAEQLADSNSAAFAHGLEAYAEIFRTAMGFVWISSPANDRAAQILAGRAWLRLNLQATALGLGLHPVSQSLQEYPQMTELYQEVHSMLAPSGGTIQMLGRVGYGPKAPPSPRWPLERKILNA